MRVLLIFGLLFTFIGYSQDIECTEDGKPKYDCEKKDLDAKVVAACCADADDAGGETAASVCETHDGAEETHGGSASPSNNNDGGAVTK